MNNWTEEELTNINRADELQIQTITKDGKLRNPVTVWVVRAGDIIYIRSVKGQNGLWYRHATDTHKGYIVSGGVSKNVMFKEANEKEDIDKAYQTKYNNSQFVGSVLTPQAQNATLQLIPASS